MLWYVLPWPARAYLFLLLCSTVAITLVAISVWRRSQRLEMNAAGLAQIASLIRLTSHLRQFLLLLFLVFSVIVTDMVFESARALELASHMDVDAAPAFDEPTAFAFVVLGQFLFLFSLLWASELSLERLLRKRGATERSA